LLKIIRIFIFSFSFRLSFIFSSYLLQADYLSQVKAPRTLQIPLLRVGSYSDSLFCPIPLSFQFFFVLLQNENHYLMETKDTEKQELRQSEEHLGAEASVQEQQTRKEGQTYHCNDCGNVIYKHEVFCSKCGKLLDRYDFE